MSTMKAQPSMVVVGASAGGVPTLREFVAGLTTDLSAPVVVVLHIPQHAPSALAAILARSGPMPVSTAAHDMRTRDGHLYVAPADHHTLVGADRLLLSSAPGESGHRPAINPLLRSAADVYGARAIGIVLSGTGDDGASGLAQIAACGGAALVQDPGEALFRAMPDNALQATSGAVALPVAELAREVCRLLAQGSPTPGRSGVS
ncbi:MAG: two-component system, chemotaxis family, protein-glutamate methylesterase/glutaminase [Nocardioidaceae bacterium]|jgi:two-component system chemotaxis response regulator CheB|nr:two-component system, chemotaxis family, protein-glutamate methylesterase/glutaminase [Nocardioidaceae bacterium]